MTVLAMEPQAIRQWREALLNVSAQECAEFRAFVDANPEGAEMKPYAVVNGVATLGVYGPLEHTPSLMGWLMGGVTYAAVERALAMADADPAVESICVELDSPGGTVTGAAECHAAVAGLSKPLHVHALNMNSAAYWVFSAAASISAAPTASVGSIGVYGAYPKGDGGALMIVSSQSPDKVPDPDNPEHVEQLRALATAQAQVFIEDVAAARGVAPDVVAATYGRGASLCAADALAAGMIDAITREIPQAPVNRQGAVGMANNRAEAPDEPEASMEEKYAAMEEELEALRARNAELEEQVKAMDEEPELEPDEEEDPEVAALKAQVAELQKQAQAQAEARKRAEAKAWAEQQIARGAVGSDDATVQAMVDAHLLAADGVSRSALAYFEALPDNATGINTRPMTTGGGSARHQGQGYQALRAQWAAQAKAEGRDFDEVRKEWISLNPGAYRAAAMEG